MREELDQMTSPRITSGQEIMLFGLLCGGGVCGEALKMQGEAEPENGEF